MTALLLALALIVQDERDVEFGKGGDTALKLDVYKPAGKADKPRPAVIFIHGGGWHSGDKRKATLADEFTKRGYVYVSVNYRLSGEAPYPAAVEDCKCAVRWLRANAKAYDVDPDRLGVFGTSAGGHLALMVGLADGIEGEGGHKEPSSKVKAVCSWFGPADFTKGAGEFEGGSARVLERFIGVSFKEKPDVYKEASPVTHASKDDPPVLMIHGDKDATVPIGQSQAMEKALKDVGMDVAFITVKNAGHGFKPAARGDKIDPPIDDIHKATLDFFDKHLK